MIAIVPLLEFSHPAPIQIESVGSPLETDAHPELSHAEDASPGLAGWRDEANVLIGVGRANPDQQR